MIYGAAKAKSNSVKKVELEQTIMSFDLRIEYAG